MLTAGFPWSTILYTLLMDEVMIVTGLVGALTSNVYKWGYYTAGCAAFFLVFYNLVLPGARNARAIGSDVGKLYFVMVGLTTVVWFLYPIAWGVAEGGNVITSDGEAVFYGILDIIAKPVFGFVTLFGHRNIDPARLGIMNETFFGAGPALENGHHKTGVTHTAQGTNGSNGVTQTSGMTSTHGTTVHQPATTTNAAI